jgi:hypothetical protein
MDAGYDKFGITNVLENHRAETICVVWKMCDQVSGLLKKSPMLHSTPLFTELLGFPKVLSLYHLYMRRSLYSEKSKALRMTLAEGTPVDRNLTYAALKQHWQNSQTLSSMGYNWLSVHTGIAPVTVAPVAKQEAEVEPVEQVEPVKTEEEEAQEEEEKETSISKWMDAFPSTMPNTLPEWKRAGEKYEE